MSTDRQRTNLILFIPDQLRYDALGCSGNEVAKTPHIDALAARGTRFSNAFGQHSVCGPSRASFLTGWYPHTNGHRTLDNLLREDEPNLLKILKEDGYHVAHAGLRGDTFAQGVTASSTSRFGFIKRPEMLFSDCPWPKEDRRARSFYWGKRKSAEVVFDFDEACIQTAEEWLAEGLPEPFVLYVPLIFPHPPFEVEEPWFSLHDRAQMPKPAPLPRGEMPRYMEQIRESYGTARMSEEDWSELIATYYGMVSRVDSQLGRLMNATEEAGVAERTATFFFTDHGEYLGDYGLVEKYSAGQHDCLLHNPLIIATPGGAKGNQVDAMVELIDIVPTLLELAETEPVHSHFGRSLNPLLADPAKPHREAAFSEGGHLPDDVTMYEAAGFPYDKKHDISRQDRLADGKVTTMRTRGWTYVRRQFESDELYDRKNDPQQLVNLADEPEHAGRIGEMREQMLSWLVETADNVPWRADPRNDFKGMIKQRA